MSFSEGIYGKPPVPIPSEKELGLSAIYLIHSRYMFPNRPVWQMITFIVYLIPLNYIEK